MPLSEDHPRRQPCAALGQEGIPCVVWFEDAIGAYGVPTVVFDLYILVPDIVAASVALEKHVWTPTPLEQGKIGSATLDIVRHPQRRFAPRMTPGSTKVEEEVEADGLPPPPQVNEPPEVVLLPATQFKFDFEKHVVLNDYLPSLEDLVDALISSTLDSLDCIDLQDHLHTQICYLYGNVPELQDRSFAERLLFEHRQFHFDVCARMSYSTLSFIDHERKVRDELRHGRRELQECSASREDENLFNGPEQARLLAMMPPPPGYEDDDHGDLETPSL